MRRRGALLVCALVAWVAGSSLGALGTVTAQAQSSGIAVGKAHAGYTPSLTGTKPIVILAVGSGARPGDDVLHSLSDSIHLIFLNPGKHRATMVGIPRDSYVDIPGHGTNKINSALFYGGPELMVQTIESISGVHIDYWAITTFWGFTDMINEIGGLTVDVPFRMYDPSYSRADLQPGVQTLNGTQALSMARDRHSMLEGDFARQENGGRLILAALAQFQKEYAKDQSQLVSWLGAGMSNIYTEIPLNEVAAARVHGHEGPGEERPERGAAGERADGGLPLGGDPGQHVEGADLHGREARRDPAQEERAAEPHGQPAQGLAQIFVSTYAT